MLSHYTARGETLFFVNGKLAVKTAERLEPRRLALGASATIGAGSVKHIEK